MTTSESLFAGSRSRCCALPLEEERGAAAFVDEGFFALRDLVEIVQQHGEIRRPMTRDEGEEDPESSFGDFLEVWHRAMQRWRRIGPVAKRLQTQSRFRIRLIR